MTKLKIKINIFKSSKNPLFISFFGSPFHHATAQSLWPSG